MDLIDRQQAIGKIKDWMKFIGYSHGERNVMECTIQMLEELPSAQTKGRWSWVQYDSISELGDWYCSECRFMPSAFNLAKKHLNYCPNCGADMRGEEDE